MESGFLATLLRLKWWFLVCLAILGQLAFTWWAAAKPEHHPAWERIITFPMWPPYADLRAMTSGWDEVAAGRDPLRLGPGAPSYNYPRVWLLGGRLGLDSGATSWLGHILIAAFGASVAAGAWLAPRWTALLFVGLLAAPPTWLGLERGNTDLFIFVLLTLALIPGPKSSPRLAWAIIAVLAAAFLKLYPVVALLALVPGADRRRWIWLAAAALIFAGYVGVTRGDVAAVLKKTDYGTRESYGARLMADKVQAALAASPAYHARVPAWAADPERRHFAGRAAATLLAGVAAAAGLARARLGRSGAEVRASGRLFLAGAAIYGATFIFSLSWAYRLVFLLWVLPFWSERLLAPGWAGRLRALAALGLLGVVFWTLADRTDFEAPWGHFCSLLLLGPLAYDAGRLLGTKRAAATLVTTA